jgi:hypothetical protein
MGSAAWRRGWTLEVPIGGAWYRFDLAVLV